MTTHCKKFIHISYIAKDKWAIPIWTVINNYEKKGKLIPLGREDREELGNIAVAISIKLDLLPFIIEQINEKAKVLYKEVRKKKVLLYEELKKRNKNIERYALSIDNNIKIPLLVDIDSLLFELYSCCELMESFVKKVLRKICKKKISSHNYVETILQQNGGNKVWLEKLKNIRHCFAHYGAPWIAICLDKEPQYELLIIKEKNFSDSTKFIRLSELDEILKKFVKMKEFLVNYLIDEIKKLNNF